MRSDRIVFLKLGVILKLGAFALCVAMIGAMIDAQPVMGSSRTTPAAVDMVLRDTPLKIALQAIAQNHGYRLDSQAELQERVNVDMSGIGFEESVQRLLAGRNYGWQAEGELLKVYQINASQSPQPAAVGKTQFNNLEPAAMPAAVIASARKILVLQNRRPDEMVGLLAPMSETVGMVADIRTNSILMTGPADELKGIIQMALELDKIEPIQGMEDKREFLSEVFSLEYISDFEDLEENLNFILYGSNQPQQQQQQQAGVSAMVEQPVMPVRREYYLLDKVRRVLMITATRDKLEIIRDYFVRVNTPLPQVLIEAQIVALDDGFERSSGINWNFTGSYQGPIKPTANPLGIPPTTAGATTIDPAEGFQFGQWNLSNLVATLEQAQAQNKGKILSQPRLMTLSGNEAKIHIGTRYPYRSATTLNQSGGTAENIEYVDVGILLNVTPQVNMKSGTIVMNLSPEVSDVVGFRNDAPIITSRQTQTVVEVADGETVVIGGLLREEDLKGKSGVPIMREIPLIGEFFRYSRKSKNKTNLIIMITPRIVNVVGKTLKEVAQEEEVTKAEERKYKYQELLNELRERHEMN